MKRMQVRALGLTLLLLLSGFAHADNMLMSRIPMRAELVLEYVKSSIEEHGYAIAHLQLCDGGMKDFGYESDLYRVVFFGKVDEVRIWSVARTHEELVGTAAMFVDATQQDLAAYYRFDDAGANIEDFTVAYPAAAASLHCTSDSGQPGSGIDGRTGFGTGSPGHPEN